MCLIVPESRKPGLQFLPTRDSPGFSGVKGAGLFLDGWSAGVGTRGKVRDLETQAKENRHKVKKK